MAFLERQPIPRQISIENHFFVFCLIVFRAYWVRRGMRCLLNGYRKASCQITKKI